MANTTYFGWETPDDTDLVKDGAAAIRTLGQAIDTSMQDLEGGTTGQILSKNSNADMDFVWVTNDVGDITAVNVSSPITGGGTSGAVTISIQDGTTAQKGAVQLENSTSSTSTTTAAVPASVKSAYDLANAAIPKSLVDAAGDLIYATANDTPARLALGTSNQILRVNSGATAPEWATVSSGAMTLVQRSSFSNVANTGTTFDAVFSSTYKSYVMVIENIYAATGGDDLHFQFRYAGPTTQAAGYYGNAQRFVYNSTTATTASIDNANEIVLHVRTGDSSGPGSGTFNINQATGSSAKSNITGSFIEANNIESSTVQALVSTSRVYTGFILKSSSTNITGSVAVYGLA
jgi:hypothetical protein